VKIGAVHHKVTVKKCVVGDGVLDVGGGWGGHEATETAAAR
jgi:hypothetical protein